MRKTKNLSVILTLIVSFVLLAAFFASLVMMPSLLKWYIEYSYRTHLEQSVLSILHLLYGAVVFAIAAIITLIIALFYVKDGRIFTEETALCLRVISWICIVEAIIFALMAKYFLLGWLITAAALFICLIVRIVKNAIEEATVIKTENDMTV